MIAESAASGGDGVGAHVFSSRDFCEFENLKVLSECLNKLKVGVHSLVTGAVFAAELTGDELQFVVRAESFASLIEAVKPKLNDCLINSPVGDCS